MRRGGAGVSSLHLIEPALARPYSGYHKPLAKKAAATLYSIVGNHAFADGNKQTLWLLLELLTDRSG